MKRAISFLLAFALIASLFAFAVPTAQAADLNVITKENPAVVIRTSFATCGYSENWGGVHTAVPIKDKPGFVLYDVIIWEDRINLYKFPNNVEHNEMQGFNFAKYDLSTKSGLKAYVKWRESFCIKSVACKNTEDISKCSSTMKSAYISFFKLVKKRTPSTNIILKYSGHGSLGFCKCMNVEDSKATLDKGVSIFGCKFALIDFGTNCQTSNTDTLNVYYPFTNYLLASQFDYGGYSMDEWDYSIFEKNNIDSQYAAMFKVGKSVKDAAKSLVNISAKWWKYCKKNIISGKHKQSMTLLDMRQYETFAAEFSKLYRKLDYSWGQDVYSLIKKHGSSKLKKLYNKLVVHYKDNNNAKSYFKWDSKAYGLTLYSIMHTVEISETSYVYDGQVHKPTIRVTDSRGYFLQEGVDYTVSYPSGRKKVGQYNIKVTVKGPYGSTSYKTFTIMPVETAIKKLAAKNDAFQVSWSKKTAQTTGYQIRYSRSASFSSYEDVWVKKNTTTSKTVKGLKSKKKYYVKMRTYKVVDGKKIYSAWTSTRTVTTK